MKRTSIIVFLTASLLGLYGLSHAQSPSTQLSSIEVEAYTISQDEIANSSASYQVIHREDFSPAATHLGDLLQSQTNTSIRTLGGEGSYSQVSIRGLSAHQVLIYLDGILLNSAQGGAVDLSAIPLDAIERIEIYPQLAPMQLGSSGLGGALNIITRRQHNTATNQIKMGIGSFGAQSLAFTQQQSHPNGFHLLQLNVAQAENNFPILNDNQTPLNPYDDREEPRHNAQTEQQNALVKLNWQINSQQDWLNQFWFNQQIQHFPNQQNHQQNEAQLDKQQIHWKSQLNSQSLAKSDWDNQLSINLQQTKELYLDPNSHIGLGKQKNYYLTQSWQIQNLGSLLLSEQYDWTLKTQVTYQQQRYLSEEKLSAVFAAPSEIERARNNLNIGFALPYFSENEHWAVTPTFTWQTTQDKKINSDEQDQATHSNDVTWQLGGIYFQNAHQIKVNLASRVRQPSFFEKYSDRGLMVGNPDLKKETGLLKEISYQFEHLDPIAKNLIPLKKVLFKATAFHNQIHHIIVQSYNARGIGRSDNMDQADIIGWEAELDLRFKSQTHINIKTGQQGSRIESNYSAFQGKRLPNFATHSVDLELQQTLKRWQATYQFHYETGRFYDRANLLLAPDQKLHHLALSYIRKAWRFTASIKNITDQTIEYFNGYPAAGRSYHLTLQQNF